jgi:hypothetical protein
VRRVLAADEKPLHWVGFKRDFLSFPAAVKEDMGNALGIAQFGGTAPTAKPWKGLGPGVLEVVESKDDAMQLGSDSIGISHNHAGYVEDGRYIPADVYESHRADFVGVHLVLDQRGSGGETSEWHLHQDLVTTLGLKREGDLWVRADTTSCGPDLNPCLR